VQAYSGDLTALIQQIKAASEKDIWLVGGGAVNALFAQAGLIDEYIISVMPVVLGDGIPLFHGASMTRRLHLQTSQSFSNGVVQLRYHSSPSAVE
jgi:dihydrofolate reductase